MKKNASFIIFVLFIFSFISCATIHVNEPYSFFKNDGRYGLIDSERKIRIPADYEHIIYVDDGYFCRKQNSSVDVYDISLKKIYSSDSIVYQYGSNGKIFFKDGDWNECVLDIKKQTVSKNNKNEKYLKSYFFNHDKGLVIEKDVSPFSFSVGTRNGTIIAKNIDQGAIVYSEGLMAIIFNDGHSGFIDEKGKLVFETSFYINPEVLSAPRKDPALGYHFNEGYSIVQQKERVWKIFEKNGQSKDVPKNINIKNSSFNMGLVVISQIDSGGEKYGYMTKDLNIIIPCTFDKAERFHGKYACVVLNGKEGVIDREGNFYSSESIMQN